MSKSMAKANLIITIYSLAGLAMLLLASISPNCLRTALAQASSWSPPERIPGYSDDADPPYLVADRNRTVHAFNAQVIDGQAVIVYSQWTLDRGWSVPVDILLLPTSYTALGAFLDRTGMIHLVFYAFETDSAIIYYSRALAVEAASARAWSPPIPVGEDAAAPASVALIGDDEGNLFVVYSGDREGRGLYAVYSTDAGDTWSESATVFLTDSDAPFPFAIRMDMDQQGRLHVVWTVNNDRGNGEAIYYARLEPDHLQWSEPIALAVRKRDGYEVDWCSIKVYHDKLFVIYDDNIKPGSIVPTRWMRLSSDGGQTWTDPVRPFDNLFGEDGSAVLLVDSNDALHIILTNRLNNVIHNVYHSIWQGDNWSFVEGIVADISKAGVDPAFPSAVISQGNVLLVTWISDWALRAGVWYSHTTLDAPELPVMPLRTPAATPTLTSTPTVSAAPTLSPSPKAVLASHGDELLTASSVSSPTAPLMAGVFPVVLLISIVVAVHSLRRSNRR